jgi:ribosomal protein S18 acetylase RimI-like enzyme
MTTLHHITQENRALLANIAEDVFDHEIAPDKLDAFLACPQHRLIVAVDGGEVIGHIRGIVHLQPDKASDLYIDNLGVTPGRQREGIAAHLIRELVAWGKAEGCIHAWVATETDNDGAKAFYASQRFQHQTIAYFGADIVDSNAS